MKKKGKKIQVTIGGFPMLVSKKEFLALVSFYNDMADFILGMEPTPTLLATSPKLLKKKNEEANRHTLGNNTN